MGIANINKCVNQKIKNIKEMTSLLELYIESNLDEKKILSVRFEKISKQMPTNVAIDNYITDPEGALEHLELKKNKWSEWRVDVNITEFNGKKIGIDALNWFFSNYSFVVLTIIQRKSGSDLFCEIKTEEILDGMISAFCNFNLKLIRHGILPVWIWDGISENNKSATKESRIQKRKDEEEKFKIMEKNLKEKNILEMTDEEIIKYNKVKSRTVKFNYTLIENLKNFCKKIGLCTIFAKDEAENLGSSLVKENKLDALWSTDTDTYPLGCNKVIIGFSKIKNKRNHFTVVYVDRVLEIFNMSSKIFIDFCILLGTDFNDNIKRIGPVKSEQLIAEYGSIENIVKGLDIQDFSIDLVNIRRQLSSYKTDHKEEEICYNLHSFDDKYFNDIGIDINSEEYFSSAVCKLLSEINDKFN